MSDGRPTDLALQKAVKVSRSTLRYVSSKAWIATISHVAELATGWYSYSYSYSSGCRDSRNVGTYIYRWQQLVHSLTTWRLRATSSVFVRQLQNVSMIIPAQHYWHKFVMKMIVTRSVCTVAQATSVCRVAILRFRYQRRSDSDPVSVVVEAQSE